jgi:hypothetical protein
MRKVLLSLAAALSVSGALAAPAMANEARIEARGGVYWTPGATKGTAGVAAGYDFDLGSSAFVGAEVSGDKILTGNTRIAVGVTGRAGIKASPADKLFVAGGYTTKPCGLCEDAVHAGAGYEHSFGQSLYGKVEYRHFFTQHSTPDSNAVVAGLGVKF